MDALRSEYKNDPELQARFKRVLFRKMKVERPDGSFGPYDPEGRLPGCIRHEGQVGIHFPETPWRTYVLRCGNRWGKSLAVRAEHVAELGIPNSRAWIAAPEYNLTDAVFGPVWKDVVQDEIFGDVVDRRRSGYTDNKRQIFLKEPYESFLKGKSAENEKSLQAEKLTLLSVDEAARVPRSAWENGLKQRTIDTDGRQLIISTPIAFNWFDEMWDMGQDPRHQEEDGIYSIQSPSHDNPYLSRERLAFEERTTDLAAFKRNILAEPGYLAGNILSSFIDKYWPEGNIYRAVYSVDKIENEYDFVMPSNATHVGTVDTGVNHATGATRAYLDDRNWLFVYWDYEQVLDAHELHAEQILSARHYPMERWVIGTDSDNEARVKRSQSRRTRDYEERETAFNMYKRLGFPRLMKQRVHSYTDVASLANRRFAAAREVDSASPGCLIEENCKIARAAIKRYIWATSRREGTAFREGPQKYNDDWAEAFMRLIASQPRFKLPRKGESTMVTSYTENQPHRDTRGRGGPRSRTRIRPRLRGVEDPLPSYMRKRGGRRA